MSDDALTATVDVQALSASSVVQPVINLRREI